MLSMTTWSQFAVVALGGALGAMCRFGIFDMLRRWKLAGEGVESGIPLATLLANMMGCFLIGMMLGSEVAEKHAIIKFGFGVGFLGALTTFSTFSAESVQQIQSGNSFQAIAYTLISLTGGVLLVYFGMMAGKRWIG